ncbi:MAG: acetylxylan esterase, partial [Planctomycetes bacterium]|nr:acetylxylan esterase [Planctomycetota bacterium]
AAGLDDRVGLCMAEVPFLCDLPRSGWITDSDPYAEIARFCRRAGEAEITSVFHTLSYFDNVNLAGRIKGRTIISVGLCDAVCPPSGIFAVYNHLNCRKQIEVYPYMLHDSNPQFTHLCIEEMAKEFHL